MDLNKVKWAEKTYSRGKNHAVLFIDSVGLSMKEGYPAKIHNFPFNGKYYIQFNGIRKIGQEDYEEMVSLLNQIIKKEPDFFYSCGVRMEEITKEIRARTNKLKETDWSKLSNQNLAKTIEEFCLLHAKVWAIPLAYSYYFYLNDIIVEKFIKTERERLGPQFDKILPSILIQEKLSEISEEKKELINIARKAIKENKIDETEIEKHWKKYSYLNNYYYW